MFGVNSRIPNLPNGIFNQNPAKNDLIYQRRESNAFSERSLFPCKPQLPSTNMVALNALSATPNGLNTTQKHATAWNMNGINTSPSSYTSTKRPGTWNSLKENDKDIWENRMKESAELLKLYKHGFADFNQNGFSGHGKTNGFLEHGKADQNRMKSDKIYLNINPEKDRINYEPLSKNTAEAPLLSHPPQKHSPSQMINGYISNAGTLISSEKETRKNSFSVDNIIERRTIDCNGNFHSTKIRTPFEHPNSGVKTWGSKSISSLSERVDSLKSGTTNSAFSPPNTSKTQIKTPELQKSVKCSNTSGLIVGGSIKENKLIIVSSSKENKTINEQRQLKNTGSIDDHATGYTLPFKTQMKRSLAIYLGVDPEIDTVQYEPLNKNISKLKPLHARHVFSSQYSKGHDSSGRKEDRDARVQSKKKSVYSCGYDVNSINLMLQNAKKRFKCYESS